MSSEHSNPVLPSPDQCIIACSSIEQFNRFRDILWPLWAPAKTREENLALRKIYQDAQYSKDGRTQAWVLVDRNDPSKAYTSVETVRRDAWSKDSDGTIREEVIYGVIAVITPEEYRRKGYSRRLLRQLHYILTSPSNIGDWPSSWGSKPDIEALRREGNIIPGRLSYLSSLAPPGFYEAALIGPDEDKREAFLTRPEENLFLTWDIPSAESSVPNKSQSGSNNWTYITPGDYDSLSPEIAQAHLQLLKDTNVKPGNTVFRVKPDGPGILNFIDHHTSFAANSARPWHTPDEHVGVRWFSPPAETSSEDSTSPAFKSTDPLLLYIPNGVGPGEMLITLLLNPTPENISTIVDFIQTISIQESQTKVRALVPPEPFAKEIIKRGGRVENRQDVPYFPHGTCWYGPKGTQGWLEVEGWVWL